MRPKKWKDIAKANIPAGIPEQDMLDMIAGFYSELKEEMRRLGFIRYEIPGLGYMELRPSNIDREIEKLTRLIGQGAQGPLNDNTQKKLDELIYARQMVTDEIEARQACRVEQRVWWGIYNQDEIDDTERKIMEGLE